MSQSLSDIQIEALKLLSGKNGTKAITGTNAVVVNCVGFKAAVDTVIAAIVNDTHDIGIVSGYASKTVLAGQEIWFGCTATSITLTSGNGEAYRAEPLALPDNPILSEHSKTAANGLTIDLDFDKTMANPTGLHASFVVTADGDPAAVTSVALKGGDATNITVTMTSAITVGQVILITIASKAIKAADGAYFLGCTALPITNITT